VVRFRFLHVSIALVLIGLLLYGHVIEYPFVHDDYVFIVGNLDIARWDHLKNIFLNPSFSLPDNQGVVNSYYRPILDVVNKGLFLVFERIPRGYHFFNVLLHITNSIFIYWLAWHFSRRKLFAFCVSLFFLIHPVQTEAVCAVAGVSNLLSTFFCCASFILYIKRGARYSAPERSVLLFLSLASFLLGLLTKESTLALPFVIVLYEIILGDLETKKKDRLGRILSIASFFGVMAGYILFRHFIVRQMLPDITLNVSELWLRLFSIPGTLLMYMRILVFPVDLHYYRSVDILRFSIGPLFILGALLISTVVLLMRFPFKEKRLAYFGLGSFILTLSPMLNIVPLINEYSLILTAEHFLYFPCVGFFVLIFVLFEQACRVIFKDQAKAILNIVVIFISVVLFFAAKEQTRYWKGEVPLFERTLYFHPSFGRVRILLARAYYFERRYQAAAKEYIKAISIIEDYFQKTKGQKAQGTYRLLLKESYFELAHCYEALGQVVQAIDSYQKAQEMDPTDSRIYNNMGIGYLYLGGLEQAAACFQKAISFDPENAMALNNLAFYYLQTGNLEMAEGVARKVLSLDPGSVSAQKNLEEILKAKKEGKKKD